MARAESLWTNKTCRFLTDVLNPSFCAAFLVFPRSAPAIMLQFPAIATASLCLHWNRNLMADVTCAGRPWRPFSQAVTKNLRTNRQLCSALERRSDDGNDLCRAAVAAFCSTVHCGLAGGVNLAVGPLGRQAEVTMQVRAHALQPQEPVSASPHHPPNSPMCTAPYCTLYVECLPDAKPSCEFCLATGD